MSPNSVASKIAEDSDERILTMEEVTEVMAQLGLEPEEPFVTLVQDTLPYQLDSIAWNHRHSVFVIGSYEIDPVDRGRRIGNLYLASLCPAQPEGYTVHQTVKHLPGVLDIKWNPSEEQTLVAATSESVLFFRLDTTNAQDPFLVKIQSLNTYPDMALYVTWLNSTDIVYSDSAGNVVTWTRGDDEDKDGAGEAGAEALDAADVKGLISSPLHKYFVWFVHFDPTGQLIYSGDDSGFFRAFHIKDLSNPSIHAKHQFDTGVTSILTKGEILAVGCYDDHLRIFVQSIVHATGRVGLSKAPLLDIDLGGTVWRTVWIPPMEPVGVTPGSSTLTQEENGELSIAVAAGRNGIHVIKFKPNDWTWETTFRCVEHQGSLAYGLDIHVNQEESTYTLATVYFDSKVLHIFTTKS